MRKLFFILSVCFLTVSCHKDVTQFRQVTFSGSIVDSLTRTGIPNVTVKMLWYSFSTAKETIIDSTLTDAQGKYSFNCPIDDSRFKSEVLNTIAVVPNGYISPLDLEHSTVGLSTIGIQSNHIDFHAFYLLPTAHLTINLNRTMNDSFNEFYLYYDYGGRKYWPIGGNLPTAQSYNVVTAAGIKTKVHWLKKLSANTTSESHDSITCFSSSVNQVTMNY